MNKNQAGYVFRQGLLLAVLGTLLAACSGDDGAMGPPGIPGPAGPPGTSPPGVSADAERLQAEISGVTIGSPPQIQFSLRNEKNVPFVGLPASSIRFTLAKLIPGSNGNPDRWQSYVNRTEQAGSVGPGTVDQIQATAERNGTLEDHGDGRYTYRFATDIKTVSSPIAVSYEPQLTHRVALQISGGGLPVVNAAYTWRPADGATDAIKQREIVTTETCNTCHGKLAIHGGGRTEIQYCVTCHNPGTVDANSGESMDMTVLVHRIHRGQNLPSVQAGGEYAVWGFRDSKHDYSDLIYPQDIRHCERCHDGANPATPQAGNWQTRPSREACGACHDDVNFETGAGHSAAKFVADNSECTLCHADGAFVGSVAQSHQIPAAVAGARFAFNILDVSNTGPGEFPQVRFSVTDPQNSDTPYTLASDPAWTQLANRASRLAVDIGWNNKDHSNVGSGSAPALPVSIDALRTATANDDGSYTVRSTVAIPTSVSGSGVVSLEGHPAGDYDSDGSYTDSVPVTSALRYFAITDTSAQSRRQVVEIAKCNQCHAQLSLHGNNRTDEPQNCVICHNANATDIRRRPADPATSLDGKVEQSIDFKYMIHAIHAAHQRETPYVAYGFGGTANDYSHVSYPGELSDCTACHSANTYALPLRPEVLATTVDTGASQSNPDDDLNITPTAAVCSSCHDGQLARAHMEHNGAAFSTPQSMVDNGSFTETCALCHGPGRSADIAISHGLP